MTIRLGTSRDWLRVVMYARFSPDEQVAGTIPDQFASCRKHLELLGFDLTQLDITEHSDAEISGDTLSRPAINQVRDEIRDCGLDILICEDSTRLFTSAIACGALVETAYSLGIRIIIINDGIDTIDWPLFSDNSSKKGGAL